MRRLWGTSAACAAAFVLVASAAPASAILGEPQKIGAADHISSAVITGSGAASTSDELAADIAAFGGLSDREVAMFSAQERFAEAVSAISAAHPDLFVDAGLGVSDTADAWIRLTGELPEDAAQLLRDLPIDTRVEWGFRANARELDSALDVAVAAVNDALPPGAGLVGSSNGDGVLIRVAAPDPWQGRRNAALRALASDAITRSATDRDQPVPVEVVRDDLALTAEPEAN